ncbi:MULTISPECIES: TadE/TadG family type IV pilus assembly protein [Rhizobium]|uniref:TadE/TadG family type IV pilus assembly protein n=1 Tax=Rhizobium TaxID=379 RepID=UPI001442053C|nr:MULTISPECIES: TadE/TadG family type IV pilus assembly protein [Rhizobium]MBY3347229.1 pilus assembly protein [Rhizobium laguerreae]MBY3354191.1 pilus assembly protein [Rhizobium laguerreae]MBY3375236.1 pilus assembly protein [Rhizobium laguerreae]MBY3430466.1 pilus assembly protein [Rhizobium laguerreae]MBY3439114.1 pilus assembly protein [Rhizobium laguerreae]
MLHRFIVDRSGNFGIMTALLVVPLFGAAGTAIDFGSALSLRTELYAAADAAAVGSITPKSDAATQANTMSGDGSLTLGKSEAQKIFFSQTSKKHGDVPVTVDISVQKAGGVLSSTVSFNATMPTTFMQVMGFHQITISGTATARYETPSYMDFFMLLDNTPSMGVGATAADITAMKNATANGHDGGKDKNCAFACHIVSEKGVEDKKSYYNVARNNGVTIRIDVVAAAVKALMAKAKDTQSMASQFRVAAYTFGKTAQDAKAAKLFKVSDLDYDLGAVAVATDMINLMSIPYQNYYSDQQTSFDEALKGIEGEIKGNIGMGTSNADRQKIVFFVADGVGDSYKPTGCTSPKGAISGRCIEPIDTSFCKKLKDRGIKVAVLYTTYLPLPDNDFYKDRVKPFETKIAAKMEECATPGFYFAVSPTEGIEEAMEALFLKIVSAPRITS